MWRHYVYVHRRLDTDKIFYVGKGSDRKRLKQPVYERAHCLDSRSQWWKNIAAKHGFKAEVIASFREDIDAQAFERQLITQIGRQALVNLTDGGDGHAGIKYNAETIEKRSAAARRPRSARWKASISRVRKVQGNHGTVKKGDHLPAAWREAISVGQRGPNNFMRGRPSPRRRAVIDATSGIEYPSVTHAANAYGVKMQTLHNMLTGFRPNSTTLRFAQ